MASEEKEALKANFQLEFDTFLVNDRNINEEALNRVRQTLHAYTLNEPVNTMYTDEIQERLRIVKVLETRLSKHAAAQRKAFEVTPLIASFFMLLPMSELKILEMSLSLSGILSHLSSLRGHIHRRMYFIFYFFLRYSAVGIILEYIRHSNIYPLVQRGYYRNDPKEVQNIQSLALSSSESLPAGPGQLSVSTASRTSQASRSSRGKKRASDGSVISQNLRPTVKEQAERSNAAKKDVSYRNTTRLFF